MDLCFCSLELYLKSLCSAFWGRPGVFPGAALRCYISTSNVGALPFLPQPRGGWSWVLPWLRSGLPTRALPAACPLRGHLQAFGSHRAGSISDRGQTHAWTHLRHVHGAPLSVFWYFTMKFYVDFFKWFDSTVFNYSDGFIQNIKLGLGI